MNRDDRLCWYHKSLAREEAEDLLKDGMYDYCNHKKSKIEEKMIKKLMNFFFVLFQRGEVMECFWYVIVIHHPVIMYFLFYTV